MSTPRINPVILCGGSGTRLWPLSRKSYPKQFAALTGETSLFAEAALRASGAAFADPLVITNEDFRFIIAEQLGAVGAQAQAILIEPVARNTAPAVLAAALWLAKSSPDDLMLVLPSDHHIPDADAFREAVGKGAQAAQAGELVTFGIAPDRPETGYGYLELAGVPAGDGLPIALNRFVEKPDAQTAEALIESGTHLWNAGIFLMSVRSIIAAFEKSAPQLLPPVQQAVSGAEQDLDFWRLDAGSWAQAEDISLDYAVMERAKNLSVVPFDAKWSDLGDWRSVWRESEQDKAGNAAFGAATIIDCEGSLVRSEDENLEVVGIGLKDTVVLAMPDAVLVADASRTQDVKLAVTALKEKSRKQATQFPRDHRPWGWFESLAIGDRFQVKRIVVNPGAALSLQSHHHRAEHWIVVQGTAKVTIDDKVSLVSENESVYIPLGAVHRMENPGKLPMVLIEVQTGSYLGEDDIVRYEDVYART